MFTTRKPKNGPLQVGVLVGTRPEAIKLAPVIRLLQTNHQISCTVISTGQHRDMLNQVLTLFSISPNFNLDLMQHNQTLPDLTVRVLQALTKLLETQTLDILLVQGDTTSAFVAALAAFYQRLPVAHVEAGLRSDNRFHPYPEEVNRRCISQIADFHFCPTKENHERLQREGIPPDCLMTTGNTGIDAFLWVADRFQRFSDTTISDFITCFPRIVLVTAHRRENFGDNLQNICHALKRIAENRVAPLGVVFATHLNPNVQTEIRRVLDGVPNILLLPPQDYETFTGLMKHASIILSDSGGVQEEAPALGKPVLVMRERTERPEAVKIGACQLVGTDPDRLYASTIELLTNDTAYRSASPGYTPYGDGHASERIVKFLLHRFGFGVAMPEPFTPNR